MKKLFVLGVILTLLALPPQHSVVLTVSVINALKEVLTMGQLTRPERFRLQKTERRYRIEKRRAFRDGRQTPGKEEDLIR